MSALWARLNQLEYIRCLKSLILKISYVLADLTYKTICLLKLECTIARRRKIMISECIPEFCLPCAFSSYKLYHANRAYRKQKLITWISYIRRYKTGHYCEDCESDISQNTAVIHSILNITQRVIHNVVVFTCIMFPQW